MRKYDLIIFDLDGTLVDTSKGIYNSVRYAEKKMGLAPTDETNLRRFVGPPPKKMYMELYGVDEDTALKATEFHREYGKKKAIYEAVLFENIESVLRKLKQQNYFLGVATLKRQDIAEMVLDNTGIKKYFDIIIGMDKGETITKSQAIQSCVDACSEIEKSLVIGDSPYDQEGAEELGVSFIGVNYGFGFNDNSQLINTPNDILFVIS